MPDRRPVARRYPRTARLNELVREIVAEELERLSDADDRLVLVTVTHVEVDADLRRAKVLLSSLSDEMATALEEQRARLQAAIGRQGRMKRTPQLSFAVDPAVTSGQRVEDILREIQHHDVQPDRHQPGD